MKINGKRLMKAAALLGTGMMIGHITQSMYERKLDEVDGLDLNLLGKVSWKISAYWKECTEKFKELVE